MVVAKFIGPIPVIIGSILFLIGGIVLIAVGAGASPSNTGEIILGVAFIIGALLLILDAVSDLRRRSANA